MDRDRSTELYAEACRYIPGGVNSPVRAFRAVGGDPLFISQASGAHLIDVDGNELVDYVLSWGPMILGHARPALVDALTQVAMNGTSFGSPTTLEIGLARRICEAVPGIERVRMVNSGTEATASVIRLARAATERDAIVKVAGCYHGHVDALLVEAGSGPTTFGHPTSPGIPEAATASTLVVPFNDLAALSRALEAHADQVAAVILEPVPGNMGVVPPADGYLAGVRELCDEHGALLIFDEVMTGFRVAWDGAQGRYGVVPDLTCLGKVIGGGLPVGAFGGGKELMDMLAPRGPVYQAGTLSGNPLAMAAGIEQLDELREGDAYERLETLGARLEDGLRRTVESAGVEACVQRVGSMLTLFFHPGPVTDYDDATACDTDAFARFHRRMLEEGIYLPASQFESWFLSVAHTERAIDATVAAAAAALEPEGT